MTGSTAPREQPFPRVNLGRRLFQNAAVLAIGRNVNALTRLVAAGLIVRNLGPSVFAQYALIVAALGIADWVLDFGTTDIYVREANRHPADRQHLRTILTGVKILQIPAAAFTLLAMLVAMRYPPVVLQAGLVATIGLVPFAGVILYRATFKATLTMGREILAETVSVAVMLALLGLVLFRGGGLIWILAAHSAGRGVFFAGCWALGRRQNPLSLPRVSWPEISWGIRSSATVGVIGFIVVIYNVADVLLLSRFVDLDSVALFSGAQRFTWPLLMALNAVGVSFYPVLAYLRVPSPEEFKQSCQRAIDSTLVLGGIALAGLLCGAEFLMAMLGPELVAGAPVLRILALMYVIKSAAMVIGQVLYLVHAQRYALTYMGIALLLKGGLVALVAPRFGFIGVAVASLLLESLFLVPVTLYMIARFTGFRPRGRTALHVFALVAVSVALAAALLPFGSLSSMVFAVVAYAGLGLGTGLVRLHELRRVMTRETA